jgi:uncharacterized protein (TIGR02466 family)
MSGGTQALKLFSVPVFSRQIPGFAERRADILGAIDALRSTSVGIVASNRGAWHSTRELHHDGQGPFGWVRECILETAREALAPLHPSSSVEPRLLNLWAIVAPAGGWLAPHQHYPAPWSGVIWVSAEHTAAGEHGADSAGRLELMNPIPLAESFGQARGATIAPKDGVLVLFPGVLDHFVHPTRAVEPRISLSFNLDVGLMPRAPGSDASSARS